MSTTIDFCIPYIPSGLSCLEYLINNLYKTAKNPEKINVIVSYHDDGALEKLKASPQYSKIHKTVFSAPFSEEMLFFPSANHSAAINELSKEAAGDIVVFSDYDMAFLQHGWDETLAYQLDPDHNELTGVAYAPLLLGLNMPKINQHIPWLPNLQLIKYQGIPNLSFFCIRRNVLSKMFSSRLTSFDNFLLNGGLPFRLINTPDLARINNLPLGSMQWLDTGYEIPEIIDKFQAQYLCYPPISYHAQNILNYIHNPAGVSIFLLPEIFCLPIVNIPFLCHFKKGSAKMGGADGQREFLEFTKCVDRFLNSQQ